MKHKNRKFTRALTRTAAISAVYVMLTFISALFGLSGGVIQLRLSESLSLLPLLFPEAVCGLFFGCIISNILFSGNILDIIFGSLATLIGAYLGRSLHRKFGLSPILSALPTLFANMLIIPPVLIFTYGSDGSYPFFLLSVGAGEFISAVVLGVFVFKRLKAARITEK